MNSNRILGTIIVLGLALGLAGQPARAATYTWDGIGGGSTFDSSGTWGAASNWWNGSADTAWSGTNSALFGATAGGSPFTVTLGASTTAAGITFASQNYTIAGGGFGLSLGAGGITANAPATISAPITLSAAQTWTNNSANLLTVSGSVGIGSNLLTIGGSGNTSLSGTMSGTAGLTMSGTGGLLTLSGSNAITGNIIVTGGTLAVPIGGSLNSPINVLVNTANVTLSGGLVVTSSDTIVGNGGAGTMTVSGGTLSVLKNLDIGYTGGAAHTGLFTQTGGLVTGTSPVNLGLFAAGASGGGTMNLNGGGTFSTTAALYDGYGASSAVNIGGSALLKAGTFALGRSANNLATISNVLNLNGGTLSTNLVTMNASLETSTVNFNGGVLQATAANAAFMTGLTHANVLGNGAVLGSGAVIETNGNAITIAQPLLYGLSGGSIDGGLTVLSSVSGGSLTLTGSNTFNGPTTVSGGTLTLASGASIASTTINVAPGGAFNALAGSSIPGTLTIGASGTINFSSAAQSTSVLNGPSTAVIGLLGPTALTVNNGGSFAGSVQDNGSGGSLILSGSQMILGGNNNYSGGTTFTGGTLQVGTGGNSGSLGSGNVSYNGTLVFSRSDTALVVPGAISGSGAVILNGAGSVTLSGNNNYMGATSVNAGTLILNGNNTGGGAYTVVAGATLAGAGSISGSVSFIHGANIAPGNNVTTGNVGTLTLPSLSLTGGGNAYFDLSNSTAGSNDLVQVNGPLTLSGTTTVVVNPYQTTVGTGDYELFAYSGAAPSGTPLVLASGGLSPRQTGHFDYTTISGEVLLDVVGVPANLTWVGGSHGGFTNTWVQTSMANTAWTLSGSASYFAVSDNVTFDPTAGINTTVTISGAVSPSSLLVTGSNSYVFTGSGLISGATALTVNMASPATLTLANSGVNSFSGGTFIQSGTLVLGANNSLPSGGTLTLGSAGGTGVLDMAGQSQQLAGLGTDPSSIAANQIVGNSAVSSTSTLTFSGIPGAPGSYFGGSIQNGINGSGGQVALTVTAGLLNLSGSNTYSGPTIISSGGTLQLGSQTALYAGAATNNAVVNGFLDLGGNMAGVNALSGSGTIANSGGGTTLTVGNNNATSTFTGSFQDQYSNLIKTGSGTLVLTGQYMSIGTTPINQGILQVTNTSALGTGSFAIANGAKLFLNYPTAVGPNWANFSGSGTLELNSAQAVNGSANWCASAALGLTNFSGTLQVDNGRVQGTPSNLGSTANVVINNGAQFLAYDGTTSGTSYVFPQNFSINGLGWGESGQNLGAVRVGGMNATFSGNIVLTGSTALYAQNAAGTAITVSGGISGNYNLTLNDSSTNSITFSGSNTYTGTTTVGGGTLDLANSAALLDSTLASGGISFDVLGGGNFTFGGLSGSGNIALIDTGSNAVALSVGNNNTSTTYSGQLSGSGSLARIGTGLLTLTASNTYAGGTTISAGTLQVGKGGNSGTLGSGNIANNALLAFSRSDTALVIPAAISGSGGLALNGAGAITLSGSNTYGGTTAVNAGTLIVNGTHAGGGTYTVAGGATLAGSGTISGGNSVTLANAANLAPGNNITTGSVGTLTLPGLSMAGGGTAYFDLSNSYTGSNDLVVAGGSLTLNGSTTVVVNLTKGALGAGNYPLFDYTPGQLSFSSSATSLVLAAGNLSPRQTAYFDYGTTISGVVSLDVMGGPLNLTWVGGTQGGFTNTWNQNVTANTVWSGSNNFDLGDNVTFDATAGTNTTVTISSTVSPSAITVTGSNGYTFSGSGSIAGATTLAVNSPGSLSINTSNTYSGGTSLAGGLLDLGNSAALGSGPLTISGGSLDNTSGTAMTLAGNNAQIWNGSFVFLGSSPLNMGSGAVTLRVSPTVTVSAGTLTVGGAISGPGYALTKNGGGTLVLAGSSGFTGGTTLSNGLLVLNNSSALGSGTLTINGGSLDSTVAGVTLANNPQNWNSDFTFIGTQSLGMGAGAVTLASSRTVTVNANTLTVGGGIGDGGNNLALTVAGAGNLTLSGSNTYGGPTTINSGTLQIAAGGTGGAFGSLSPNSTIINNGTIAFDRSDTMTQGVDFSGSAITGSGGLIQKGVGTLILTVSNTYSGPTTISNGVLQIGNSSAGAAVASQTISAGAGALLAFGPSDSPTYGGAISGLGSVDMSGPGMMTLSGSNTFTGFLEVTAGTLAVPAGGIVTGIVGSIYVNGANLVISGGLVTTGTTASVRVGYGSSGTMTVTGGTLSVGQNDVVNSGQNIGIGNPTGAASGVFNQTGGFVTDTNPVNLAFGLGAGGGTMNLSGGTFDLALPGESGNLYNGYGASSTVNISGSAYANIPTFNMGRASVATTNSPSIINVLNLNGGTLSTNTVVNNGNGLDTNTVNFNGGLLEATTASTTFLQGMTNAFVLAGGAIINDGGNVIGIEQNLQSGATPDGGLTKLGAGELILSGTNTYNGQTYVEAGTLIENSASALPAGTSLTVGQDAQTIMFAPALAGPAASAPAGVVAVPEPGTLMLLLAGLGVALGVMRKRKPISNLKSQI